MEEETTDSPLTGVGAEPVRFWELDPPDKVLVSPDTVRLQSLNPLRDKSPPPKGWWDSVRGLKCLQRLDLMFKRIWLRSIGVDDDDNGDVRGDEEVGRWEELAGSEVLVSEVLALELRSGELGSGEVSGSGSGSESRLWQMLSRSVCALSNKTLKHKPAISTTHPQQWPQVIWGLMKCKTLCSLHQCITTSTSFTYVWTIAQVWLFHAYPPCN